jgi:UDP-N-acetylmuramoylalanine--D-glutamate ligase
MEKNHQLPASIGIWGFGIVGKAAFSYFISRGIRVGVMDRRALSDEDQKLLALHNVPFYTQSESDRFFADFPSVLASPGVDIRPFRTNATWISELDLVGQHIEAPIIAITGTLGKTTTTALLAHTLRCAGKSIWVGGNIGIGCLELLNDPKQYDYILLEVSSFQLDLCSSFAPHIAVFTNFHENHLDRHGTVDEYFAAKHKIFEHQQATDFALIPPLLASKVTTHAKRIIMNAENLPIAQLAHVTYPENIIAVATILQTLGLGVQHLVTAAQTFVRDEHRLEKVGLINGATLYNDSKSTVPQATLAALEQLTTITKAPIILIVGGVSKGVDRAPFIHSLQGKIKQLICFGAEAATLSAAAKLSGISTITVTTLEQAVEQAVACASSGDQILFSPAGASFDLFANYQERGQKFKALVAQQQT